MIISRTPLRITFLGGGTDLKEFFQDEQGCVVNAAINKCVYIAIHEYFDDSIQVKYSKTELVDNVEDIQHPLFREAMKLTGVTKGVEIASFADIPSRGSGLGSSSSFLVGLLNALWTYKGENKTPKELAEAACKIEREILKEHGGYQDQYITAFGNMQFIQFNTDNSIMINPINISTENKQLLEKRLLVFYTGITRNSHDIQKQVHGNKEKNKETLQKIKQLTLELKQELENGNLDAFGELLNQGWELKRNMSDAISNNEINNFYEKAKQAGAIGGKLMGAGGGGFLLFYAHENTHNAIRNSLSDLKELEINFEQQGSKIIYIQEDN
jgi:D-glycero-alpha-D-manno-heptose-7-phosphate kinase